jgi:hypothetical protein
MYLIGKRRFSLMSCLLLFSAFPPQHTARVGGVFFGLFMVAYLCWVSRAFRRLILVTMVGGFIVGLVIAVDRQTRDWRAAKPAAISSQGNKPRPTPPFSR